MYDKENVMTNLQLNFVKIPESDFTMGSKRSNDRDADNTEMPAQVLHVSDFYMMKYPVTNAQYNQFVQAVGCRPPLFWPDGEYPAELADHPVVGVSYFDAMAFCAWAAKVTGLPVRLPTEPEWEKAARGPELRVFPWGDKWDNVACNTSEAKLNGTSAVDQFSPQGDSPYGIAEMGGNVQEWSSSLYGPYPYDPTDGREAHVYDSHKDEILPQWLDTGCTSVPNSVEASQGKSVIRGGSWRETKFRARCAYRSWAAPLHRSDDTGFRCCYEPQE